MLETLVKIVGARKKIAGVCKRCKRVCVRAVFRKFRKSVAPVAHFKHLMLEKMRNSVGNGDLFVFAVGNKSVVNRADFRADYSVFFAEILLRNDKNSKSALVRAEIKRFADCLVFNFVKFHFYSLPFKKYTVSVFILQNA